MEAEKITRKITKIILFLFFLARPRGSCGRLQRHLSAPTVPNPPQTTPHIGKFSKHLQESSRIFKNGFECVGYPPLAPPPSPPLQTGTGFRMEEHVFRTCVHRLAAAAAAAAGSQG